MRRPDIDDRLLAYLLFITSIALTTYFFFLPDLSSEWKLPGSPRLYLMGVVGSAFLFVSFLFVLAKRTGKGGSPPAWFTAHVVTATVGTVFVAVHSGGRLRYAPALLLLALLGLILLGVWARIRLSRRISSTFGTKHESFAPLNPLVRDRLEAIIRRKERLLERIDPQAQEGTFSLTVAHWLSRPSASFSYFRLVSEETRLLGTRGAVTVSQAYWRWAHMGLAVLFLLGLIGHVLVVTFFAGYVSGGEEIYWWHLTAW
jgi:hypothetical protein